MPRWTVISHTRRWIFGLHLCHHTSMLSCGLGLERSNSTTTHNRQYEQHTSTDQPQLVGLGTHQPHLPHGRLWYVCGRYLCGIVVTTWWHEVWPSVGLCGFCGDLCGQHWPPQRSIIMFQSNTGQSYACIRWPLWLSHGHHHGIDGATHLHHGGMAVSRPLWLLWPSAPYPQLSLGTYRIPSLSLCFAVLVCII